MSMGTGDRNEIIEKLSEEMRNLTGQAVLYSQAAADRLGINPTDFECMGLLQQYGPMTAGRLAELTGLTTGAITGVVDRLEKGEFVKRENDPDDRRRVIIRTIPQREAEAFALTTSLQEAAAVLYKRYKDEELALVLDFMARANKMGLEETLKLREGKSGKSPDEEKGKDFSAPLGEIVGGRLIFTSGSVMLNLHAGGEREELFQAHFEKPVPTVRTNGGTVMVRYPRFQISDWLLNWRDRPAEVTLSKLIPWQIDLLGGVNKVNADLRELMLISLEVSGGVNETVIKLPRPISKTPVTIIVAGGVNKVTIYRPEDVGVQAYLPKGAANLRMDNRNVRIDSDTKWQSRNYESTKLRYHLTIRGGANHITLATM
jgi:DNA-binding MarR family transcriptional regulator